MLLELRRPSCSAHSLRAMLLSMVLAEPAAEERAIQPDEEEERAFLRSVAQGLADDAAGRVMSTDALKAELERKLGPIAWR